MTTEKVNQFLDDVTQWASVQPGILALALVGSYARNAARETSDIDLVLIATKPGDYLEDRNWLEQFGIVERLQVEPYGPLTSIRAWYSDGREIEYGITDEKWAEVPLDEGSRRVIADGMRVLFERGAILSRHLKN
jgi:predicted nucleotidyltransferase